MANLDVYSELFPLADNLDLSYDELNVRKYLIPTLRGAQKDSETGDFIFPEYELEVLELTDSEELYTTLEHAVDETQASIISANYEIHKYRKNKERAPEVLESAIVKEKLKIQKYEEAAVVMNALKSLYRPYQFTGRQDMDSRAT